MESYSCIWFGANEYTQKFQKYIESYASSHKHEDGTPMSKEYVKTAVEVYLDNNFTQKQVDGFFSKPKSEESLKNLIEASLKKVMEERNILTNDSVSIDQFLKKDAKGMYIQDKNDPLGNYLKEAIQKLDVKIVTTINEEILESYWLGGAYSVEDKAIYIDKEYGDTNTLKHEMIHAVSNYYLHYNDAYLKDLKDKDILMPIGTSGSGKSTWIKSLPNSESYVIISPDEMRVEFTGDMNNKSKDDEIYAEAAKRAINAIKEGRKVIFDTTNLKKDRREAFTSEVYKHSPDAKISYKIMPLNAELAKQRIAKDIAEGKNRANVSPETIDRHAKSYPQALEDIKNEKPTVLLEPKPLPENIQSAITDIYDAYTLFKQFANMEYGIAKMTLDEALYLDLYGVLTVDEFIAELPNPNFRNYLKKADAFIKKQRENEEGIIDKIINAIKKFLGIDDRLAKRVTEDNFNIEKNAVKALMDLMVGADIAALNEVKNSARKATKIESILKNHPDVREYSYEDLEVKNVFVYEDEVIKIPAESKYTLAIIKNGKPSILEKSALLNYSYKMFHNRVIAKVKDKEQITLKERTSLNNSMTTKQILDRRSFLSRQFNRYVREVVVDPKNGLLSDKEINNFTDEEVINKLGTNKIFSLIRKAVEDARDSIKDRNKEDARLPHYELFLEEDNWNALCELALNNTDIAPYSFLVKHREPSNLVVENVTEEYDDSQDEDVQEYSADEVLEGVESFDHDKSAQEVSLYKSASKECKLYLDTILDSKVIVGEDGNAKYIFPYLDDLGFPKPVGKERAYATLKSINQKFNTTGEFLEELKRRAGLDKLEWLNGVYQDLSNNERLLNTVFSATKGVNILTTEVLTKGGEAYINILNISDNSVDYLNKWSDDIKKHTIDKNTINEGVISNAEKSYGIVETVPEKANIIKDLLSKVGVNFEASDYVIENILKYANSIDEKDGNAIKNRLIQQATSIVKTISGNNVKNIKNSRVFIDFASFLNEFKDTKILNSYYKDGKRLFSDVSPSRITDILNNLKNEDYMTENYRKVKWFYDDQKNQYKNDWLRKIAKGSYYPELMINKFNTTIQETKDFFTGRTTYYNRNTKKIAMTSKKNMLDAIRAHYNYGDDYYTFYPLPHLSDSANYLYMLGPKYKEDELLPLFIELAEQEIQRIAEIEDRNEYLSNEERVANYDIVKDKEGKIKDVGGAEFVFFPILNDYRFKYSGRNISEEEYSLSGIYYDDKHANSLVEIWSPLTGEKSVVLRENILSTIMPEILNQYYENYIKETKDKDYEKGKDDGDREFFFNQMYAYNSIVQLTIGDLAYFKRSQRSRILDFQKRYKGLFGRTVRPATSPNETMSFLTLKDDEIMSEYRDEIHRLVDTYEKQGIYSETEAMVIKNAFDNINNTDGQGLISPKAYAKILQTTGLGNQRLIDALNQLSGDIKQIKPELIKENLSLFFNPLKPFVQTNDIVPERDGEHNESIPIQIKNSERLNLPINYLSGSVSKSPKLRALFRIMEKYNIDRIQFESAIKHGKRGVIDINNLKDEDETDEYLENKIYKYLENKIVNDEGKGIIVRKLPYSAYGIQVRTDSIHEEATQGSQFSKMIMGEIGENANFTLLNGNVNLNSEQLRSLMVVTQNALVNTDEERLKERFLDKNGNIDENKLKQEISEKLQKGVFKDDDLSRAISLGNVSIYDPTTENTTLRVLASEVKGAVHRRKIKGNTLKQATSWGISDTLKCNFEVIDKNERIPVNREWYERMKKDPNVSYIDWLTANIKEKKLILKDVECLVTAPDKVIQKALTDKNGNIDINRKGNDGKFILDEKLKHFIGYRIPTEGLCSIFNFKAKEYLPNCYGNTIIVPAEFIALTGSDFDIDTIYTMMYEHESDNKGHIKAIEANLGNIKDYKSLVNKIGKGELKKEALSNLWIDMCSSMLQSPDSLQRQLYPSSYKTLKSLSYYMDILNSIDETAFENNEELHNVEAFLKLSQDDITTLADKYASVLTPLTVQTYLDIHDNNMAGKTLIGMYAVAKGLHNIFISTNTKTNLGSFNIKDPNDEKGFSSDTYTRFYDRKGRWIGYNIGEMQASSVDNGKDPILYLIAQNPLTAPMANVMLLSGFTLSDVALFFNQPAVKKAVREYIKKQDKGTTFPDFEQIINKVKEEYGSEIEGSNYNTEDFIKDIVYKKQEDDIAFKERQAKVLNGLLLLSRQATDIRVMSEFLRADTIKTAMPGTKAELIKRRLAYDYIKNNQNLFHTQIDGFNYNVDNNDSYRGIDYLNNFINKGFLDPLSTIIQPVLSSIGSLYDVCSTLYSGIDPSTIPEEAIEDIERNIILYAYSNYGYFRSNKERILSEDFKNHVDKLRRKNPDYFSNNYFLKYLNFDLEFQISDPTNKNIGEQIKADWEDMLYHKDPKIQNLALELFIYSFYTTQFRFTRDGFSQYIPTSVIQAMPGYTRHTNIYYTGTLRGLGDKDFFIQQYVSKGTCVFPRVKPSKDKRFSKSEDNDYYTYKGEVSGPMFVIIDKTTYKKEEVNTTTAIYRPIKLDVKPSSFEYDYMPSNNFVDPLSDIQYEIEYGNTFDFNIYIEDGKKILEKDNYC